MLWIYYHYKNKIEATNNGRFVVKQAKQQHNNIFEYIRQTITRIGRCIIILNCVYTRVLYAVQEWGTRGLPVTNVFYIMLQYLGLLSSRAVAREHVAYLAVSTSSLFEDAHLIYFVDSQGFRVNGVKAQRIRLRLRHGVRWQTGDEK